MRRYVLISLSLLTFCIPIMSYAGQNAEGLYAWGKNNDGQVGDGTNANRTSPMHITHADIIAISAGGYHSLALKRDGTVWAWGDNDHGQLGDEANIDRNMPVPVRGLQDIKAISAGGYHSLALKNDGTVWAWGYNEFGQLGDGTNENRGTPIQILTGVKAIAAGHYHSLALKNDGTVWAWGSNDFSQLGNGVNGNKNTPIYVLNHVEAIAAGGFHSLALSFGEVKAWGRNKYGQLGNGSTTGGATPVAVTTTGSDDDPLGGIIAIAGGRYHSLALKNDGTVWAWGYNWSGQLGDGTDIISSVDRRTVAAQVLNLINVIQISAGESDSLALKNDGTVWAWGSNSFGQLGDGTNSRRLVPTRVSDLTKGVLISAGTTHSLAVKLRSNEPECKPSKLKKIQP